MLVDFYRAVRAAGVPVTLRELLDLVAALQRQVVSVDLDAFYTLARLVLVKDEKYYDRFDRACAGYFTGIADLELDLNALPVPEDWLRDALMRQFSPEELAAVRDQGDLAELLRKFQERLKQQQERHQGGNKWIGTGGTSPFGAGGYNPAGFRIGQHRSRQRRAIKVWDERRFRDLDDRAELDTRQFQIALRRLRVFAREGAREMLDLDGTIAATARNAGHLDLRMVAERHNAAKVLLLFDVGGSMDEHVQFCETLFQAARGEFKHLEHYYFHNCVYETLWRENARRHQNSTPTQDILNRYGRDYRLIIVGDASMSPYELAYPGGSVEHMNAEPGAVWLQRLLAHFEHAVWLNPLAERHWQWTQSIQMVRQLLHGAMYPLTAAGIDTAMRRLR